VLRKKVVSQRRQAEAVEQDKQLSRVFAQAMQLWLLMER
jgi:hypothetical protein